MSAVDFVIIISRLVKIYEVATSNANWQYCGDNLW